MCLEHSGIFIAFEDWDFRVTNPSVNLFCDSQKWE